MPIPVVIAGAALGASALNRYVTSRKQLKKAEQYAKTERPDFEIPQAVLDYVNRSKAAAGTYGLPGQGILENKIYRSGAGTNDAIYQSQQSPSAMLQGIIANDANTKEAITGIGVDAANYKAANEDQYDQALNQLGDWQYRKWEWDKQKPYLSAMAAASSYENAGMLNQQQVFDDVASMISNFAMMPGNGKQGNPGMTAGEANGSSNVAPIAPRAAGPIPTGNPYGNADVESPYASFDLTTNIANSLAPYNDWIGNVKQGYSALSDEQLAKLLSRLLQ